MMATKNPKQSIQNINRNPTEGSSNQNATNKKNELTAYDCVMCNQKFQTHCQLKNHFRKHGNNEIDLRGRPMLESTLLKHPKKNSVSFELIECEWCPEAFQNISKAIEHKFRKHRYESTNYFCEICGKLYPLKVALDQHMSTEHKNMNKNDENVSEKPKFQCSFCNVCFQTTAAVEFHEKCVHHMEQKLFMPTMVPPPSKKIKINNSDEIISLYYCHLCGSEYMVKYNLRKHLENYHKHDEIRIPPEGIIKCKACESIFYSKKAYEAHNIHHRSTDLYVTSEAQRQKVVNRVDQDFDIRRVPLNVEKYCKQTMKTKSTKSNNTIKNQKKDPESDEELSPVSDCDTSEEELSNKPTSVGNGKQDLSSK